jgi:hypothetical protein
LEITGAGAGGEETGGIVPLRQLDPQGFHAGVAQLDAQAPGRSLAAAIAVGVEADISNARIRPA